MEFLTEKKKFAKKCSWGLKTGGGGEFWGVWGAPRPHPGAARGRKTIHGMYNEYDRVYIQYVSGTAWRSTVIIRKNKRR